MSQAFEARLKAEKETARKAQLLDELWWELMQAPLMPPCRAREGIVAGEGSPHARVALIGEAPGEQEEKQGRPFVGRAGQLLRRTLEEVGISIQDVWISNVVKCRPIDVRGSKVLNRAPTPAEARQWTPWLMRELDILRPRIIVCLGNIAARVLIGKDFKMMEDRGKWYPGPFDSLVLATYHPSFVLRQIGPAAESVRQEFRRDLEEVKRRLQAIS